MAISQHKTHTPFTLEDLYNKYEGSYKHNLSSACMPAMSLDDLLSFYSKAEKEKFTQEIFTTKLDYSSQFGLDTTREALVENLYPGLRPENFLLTTGASEAIFLTMSSLFDSGDSIIVQKPIYQSLYQVAQDRGVKIIDWELDLETMTWDINELLKLIRRAPSAKALVINNPNNPVGTVFSEKDLKEIVGILDGRLLVSDEVFLPISLQPTKAVCEIYEHGISISDLSKSFNMPGLRLGWVASSRGAKSYDPTVIARSATTRQTNSTVIARSVTDTTRQSPNDILETLSSHKNYLSLRNNTLSELIAPWLLNKTPEITTKNKKLIQKNLDEIYSQNPEDLFFDLSQKRESISSLCFFPRLKKELDLQYFLAKDCFLALGEDFSEKYRGFCRVGLGSAEIKSIGKYGCPK